MDARAKVNLRLKIFRADPADGSGYHPIQTVFCRVSLHDRVRLRLTAEGVRLRLVGGRGVPAGPENLAVRAAEAFRREMGLAVGLDIELEKRIPVAAGLGGGSSDAAAVLRGFNRLAGEPLSRDRLLALAATVGSDVPFFVLDRPLAAATGRGERIVPLDPLPPVAALLVYPAIPISTAEAYRAWDAHAPSRARPPERPEGTVRRWRSWDDVAADAENDFEPVVFAMHPELAAMKRRLMETRPYFALLSGSGSAFFAPYRSDSAADAARAAWAGVPGVEVLAVRAPE